jgi:hypothetical protein
LPDIASRPERTPPTAPASGDAVVSLSVKSRERHRTRAGMLEALDRRRSATSQISGPNCR